MKLRITYYMVDADVHFVTDIDTGRQYIVDLFVDGSFVDFDAFYSDLPITTTEGDIIAINEWKSKLVGLEIEVDKLQPLEYTASNVRLVKQAA